ncbi:MAG: tetratricopeptide repeat protein, partial [Planctomycetes bacterium]|nr:tetratricopeptide repeat protein [Planctomycetota bacterium]
MSVIAQFLPRIISPPVILVSIVLLATASSGCKMAADGQNLQGVRLYQQGQYDAAMQNFQKALATDPDNPDAYYNVAATVHRMGVSSNDPNMLAQASGNPSVVTL